MAAKEEKTIEFHTVDVNGTKINFPFEPYDLQVAYMQKVLSYTKVLVYLKLLILYCKEIFQQKDSIISLYSRSEIVKDLKRK